MTIQEKNTIEKLRQNGYGYKKIAAELNLPIGTVKTYCKRHLAMEDDKQRCPVCETVIKQAPHKKEKRFCSDKCRMKWWKEHPDLINRPSKYEYICSYCGKNFSSRNPKRKYCSQRCYIDSRRKGGERHE